MTEDVNSPDPNAMQEPDRQTIKYALAEAVGLPTGNAWTRFCELPESVQETLVAAIAKGERGRPLLELWNVEATNAMASRNPTPDNGGVSPETPKARRAGSDGEVDSVTANAANTLHELPIGKKWIALLNDEFGSAESLREFLVSGGDLAARITGIGPKTEATIRKMIVPQSEDAAAE